MNERNELKNTINAIIATDKKARNATEKVRENAKNSDAHIKQRVDAVRDEYMSRALRRIEVIKAAEEEYAADEWAKKSQKFKDASDKLDRLYAEMGDKWVDDIVNNVIGANQQRKSL